MKTKSTHDKVTFFCKKNFSQVGLEFSSKDIRDEFFKIFLDYSECIGVELFNTFKTIESDSTILYLNPSKTYNEPGFYQTTTDKVALNFHKAEVEDFFINLLNLNNKVDKIIYQEQGTKSSLIILTLKSDSSFTTTFNIDLINEQYPENINFNLLEIRKNLIMENAIDEISNYIPSDPIPIPKKKSIEYINFYEFEDIIPLTSSKDWEIMKSLSYLNGDICKPAILGESSDHLEI